MARILFSFLFFAVALLPFPSIAAAQTPKATHTFAEGINVPGWDTHFYLRNYMPFESRVRVTVLGEDRWPVARVYTLGVNQTLGISMANDFAHYRTTFGTTFETENNNGIGGYTVERYVLRDGIGVLTHLNKDVPPARSKTFAPCNPGAAHTYLIVSNPNYANATVHYSGGGNVWNVFSLVGKSRRTIYFAGDPTVTVTNLYANNAGLVYEKLTYNADHTAAKICAGN